MASSVWPGPCSWVTVQNMDHEPRCDGEVPPLLAIECDVLGSSKGMSNTCRLPSIQWGLCTHARTGRPNQFHIVEPDYLLDGDTFYLQIRPRDHYWLPLAQGRHSIPIASISRLLVAQWKDVMRWHVLPWNGRNATITLLSRITYLLFLTRNPPQRQSLYRGTCCNSVPVSQLRQTAKAR